MNHSENRGIYNMYTNADTNAPESNLPPETQRYIDNNIVPVVKVNPEMIDGMVSYLNSQGIFDPGAMPYIRSRI
jgi:hypothetical protein